MTYKQVRKVYMKPICFHGDTDGDSDIPAGKVAFSSNNLCKSVNSETAISDSDVGDRNRHQLSDLGSVVFVNLHFGRSALKKSSNLT